MEAPAKIVLVGKSGCGKRTLAERYIRTTQYEKNLMIKSSRNMKKKEAHVVQRGHAKWPSRPVILERRLESGDTLSDLLEAMDDLKCPIDLPTDIFAFGADSNVERRTVEKKAKKKKKKRSPKQKRRNRRFGKKGKKRGVTENEILLKELNSSAFDEELERIQHDLLSNGKSVIASNENTILSHLRDLKRWFMFQEGKTRETNPRQWLAMTLDKIVCSCVFQKMSEQRF